MSGDILISDVWDDEVLRDIPNIHVLTINRGFVPYVDLLPSDEIRTFKMEDFDAEDLVKLDKEFWKVENEFHQKIEEMSVQLDHNISEAVSEHFWELL